MNKILTYFFKKNIRNPIIPMFATLFLVLLPHNGFGQQLNEYDVKSAFLLKIPNFIEWPATVNAKNPDFTILIIGESAIEKALTSNIKNTGLKIRNKKVVVKKISSVKEIKDCYILFIAPSEKYNLSKISKATKTMSILTISDSEGFADNGVILNMIIEGTIKFEINKVQAESSGIYISSKLLEHAKNVIK